MLARYQATLPPETGRVYRVVRQGGLISALSRRAAKANQVEPELSAPPTSQSPSRIELPPQHPHALALGAIPTDPVRTESVLIRRGRCDRLRGGRDASCQLWERSGL